LNSALHPLRTVTVLDVLLIKQWRTLPVLNSFDVTAWMN
jgi:hypothetical protein